MVLAKTAEPPSSKWPVRNIKLVWPRFSGQVVTVVVVARSVMIGVWCPCNTCFPRVKVGSARARTDEEATEFQCENRLAMKT